MNHAMPVAGIGLEVEMGALLPAPLPDATTATSDAAKLDRTSGRAWCSARQAGGHAAYSCVICAPHSGSTNR